jgi:hypothetical protein
MGASLGIFLAVYMPQPELGMLDSAMYKPHWFPSLLRVSSLSSAFAENIRTENNEKRMKTQTRLLTDDNMVQLRLMYTSKG